MMDTQPLIDYTDFSLPAQQGMRRGKVYDAYDLATNLLFVATDRFSAFDRNLAFVPQKGKLLTAISQWWFRQTEPIIANHIIGHPDPNAALCRKLRVVPIEVIVRGYITGVTSTSLWQQYHSGRRDFGDFTLPDGLRKNQQLPEPVLTPTTKFEAHDRPLSPEEAVEEGLVTRETWRRARDTALELFRFGQKTARDKGLILVDTKYEFGLDEHHNLVLIDELHTPDSSRYWRADDYQAKIARSEEPDNYDKEFLRLWFKTRFDPYHDEKAPQPPEAVLRELANRYASVYNRLTGKRFTPSRARSPLKRIESNVVRVSGGYGAVPYKTR